MGGRETRGQDQRRSRLGGPSRGRRLGLRACLGLLAAASALACQVRFNDGGFDDDAGSDEAAPPDLPQQGCDPKAPLGEEGCPDGLKCSYVDDPELGPSNRCVEVLGQGFNGAACTILGESDDCAPGRICWGTEADGTGGVCVEFCDAALACSDEATQCSVANDGLLPLCLPRCDPLAQDCEAGWGCYPDADDRWVCDRDRSGELGAHGDPCACLNCCDPGQICVPGPLVDAEACGGEDGAASCCASLCELADGDPVEGVCPSETERCERFYPPGVVVLGLEDLGVCER